MLLIYRAIDSSPATSLYSIRYLLKLEGWFSNQVIPYRIEIDSKNRIPREFSAQYKRFWKHVSLFQMLKLSRDNFDATI
jgi:hypothetical protein